MKQALKQQGFTSLGRNMTEWRAWMEREKQTLAELAQAHEFEIVSLGGGRKHMDLPEYRAAAQRLEAVQEQVIAADQELADLEKQKKALGGTVKALKAAEKVRVRLDTIQPEKTLTGAVKGVTVEQVEQLKAAALRGVQAEQRAKEAEAENRRLQGMIPSTKEKLREAQAQQKIRQENQQLQVENEYLQEQLEEERSFSARLLAGIDAALDYLWEHLPEPLRPIIEKAQQLIPVPDVQKPEQKQERGHSWGDMSL